MQADGRVAVVMVNNNEVRVDLQRLKRSPFSPSTGDAEFLEEEVVEMTEAEMAAEGLYVPESIVAHEVRGSNLLEKEMPTQFCPLHSLTQKEVREDIFCEYIYFLSPPLPSLFFLTRARMQALDCAVPAICPCFVSFEWWWWALRGGKKDPTRSTGFVNTRNENIDVVAEEYTADP